MLLTIALVFILSGSDHLTAAKTQSTCKGPSFAEMELNYSLPIRHPCGEKTLSNGTTITTIPKLIRVKVLDRCSRGGIPGGHRICRRPDCLSGPCQRGWCEETMEGYLCHCPEGFSGKDCSEAYQIITDSPRHGQNVTDDPGSNTTTTEQPSTMWSSLYSSFTSWMTTGATTMLTEVLATMSPNATTMTNEPTSMSNEATTMSNEVTTMSNEATTMSTETTTMSTEVTTLSTEAIAMSTEAPTILTEGTTILNEATTLVEVTTSTTPGIADAVYIGCFMDDSMRVLPRARDSSDDGMTIERCIAHCRESNYVYAGLQSRQQCFCGTANDYYDRLGSLEEEKCQLPCTGDESSFCGGTWAVAVYSI